MFGTTAFTNLEIFSSVLPKNLPMTLRGIRPESPSGNPWTIATLQPPIISTGSSLKIYPNSILNIHTEVQKKSTKVYENFYAAIILFIQGNLLRTLPETSQEIQPGISHVVPPGIYIEQFSSNCFSNASDYSYTNSFQFQIQFENPSGISQKITQDIQRFAWYFLYLSQ